MALVTLCVVAISGFSLAEVINGKLSLKAGDEVYVCACGEGCPCETISSRQGKCSCGKNLALGKVVKVESDKATISVNGTERSFKTTGKYQCACGPKCTCNTISQKPGECGCGKEMSKVGK